MFRIYVLYSPSLKRYYVGHSKDHAARLNLHNLGRVRSTKRGIPWVLFYTEDYVTKQDAYRRELKIKSYKGGEAFRRLLEK